MSDIDNDTQAALEAQELESLKSRADLLGLKYHPSISADKLRAKIQEKLADEKPAEEAKTESAEVSENARRLALKKESNKLVRIRLTCLNPAKKEWPGEIIAVGNSVVGTFRKFIPFNAEEGYHVPQIIFNYLKDRTFQEFRTVKSQNGVAMRKGSIRKEFGIEVLEPLTAQEYDDIARRQAATGSNQ